MPFLILTTSEDLNILLQYGKLTAFTSINEELGEVVMTIQASIMVEELLLSVESFLANGATEVFDVILSTKDSIMRTVQDLITNTTQQPTSFVEMLLTQRYLFTRSNFKREVLLQEWCVTVMTTKTLQMITFPQGSNGLSSDWLLTFGTDRVWRG
ncbi:hypothetical protein WICPIJ_008056 [Wickerhamomyces pijperi]|uniref:Uncharacterized protein n=1 Tax=Wickerhamomyces pijperi TaxID=599730 RepID=A0A9P8TJB9_WICPI|nr:hypothetical protein WICPIJ_008056 [Wickerhamomyces pijperi]